MAIKPATLAFIMAMPIGQCKTAREIERVPADYSVSKKASQPLYDDVFAGNVPLRLVGLPNGVCLYQRI